MNIVREMVLADGRGENLIRATRGLDRLNSGQGYPLQRYGRRPDLSAQAQSQIRRMICLYSAHYFLGQTWSSVKQNIAAVGLEAP
jgi:hypothetical protein